MDENEQQYASFLTPEQTAEWLGVSRAWIYRKARAGELPVVRLGDGPLSPIRIDPRDIRCWLKASQTGQREHAVLP
ncbi:MAG: helix-turn-helix domain-containing protein [Solirubrobacteraceae bacterium]